jgi:hypothetical protein
MNSIVDTITLADGTKISTKNGKKVKDDSSPTPGFVRVPTNAEAVRAVTTVRMRIADLPLPPRQMNIVSVVLTYSMVGMLNYDIAIATGLSEEQVQQIKMSQAYNILGEQLQKSIAEQDMEDVRNVIKQHAHRAVNKIVEVIEDGDDKNALKAAQDILDRAGHRPADVVHHMHSVEGGLKIEYIEKKDERSLPTIDLEVNK